MLHTSRHAFIVRVASCHMLLLMVLLFERDRGRSELAQRWRRLTPCESRVQVEKVPSFVMPLLGHSISIPSLLTFVSSQDKWDVSRIHIIDCCER